MKRQRAAALCMEGRPPAWVSVMFSTTDEKLRGSAGGGPA